MLSGCVNCSKCKHQVAKSQKSFNDVSTLSIRTQNVAPIIKEVKKKTLNPLILVRNAQNNLSTLLTILQFRWPDFDDIVALSSWHELNKSFYFKWFYDFIVAFELTQSFKFLFVWIFQRKIDYYWKQYSFTLYGNSNGRTYHEIVNSTQLGSIVSMYFSFTSNNPLEWFFRNLCIFNCISKNDLYLILLLLWLLLLL